MKSQVRVLPLQIKAISLHALGPSSNKPLLQTFPCYLFFGIDLESHLSIAQSLIENEFTPITATSHLNLPSVSIGQSLA
jgi:hypothetical protein